MRSVRRVQGRAGLRALIEVSQREKLIRDDLDPRYLTIVLLGLVFFWLDNRNHFGHRFGPEINDGDYLRQAVAVLERGLAPESGAETT